MGIPHGEMSRREIRSDTFSAQPEWGLTIDGPPSRRTLSRTPVSRAIGERRTDEASAKYIPQHPAPAELG